MTPLNNIIHYEDFKYKESHELRGFLKSREIRELQEKVNRDMILVLGGDGTMLSAVKKYHGTGLPLLGINFGHKGFLLNERSVVSEDEFVEKSYPLLECSLKVGESEVEKFIALNEIDIRAAEGNVITLDINLSQRNTIHLAGDGALIATPAGSTAYNQSLGGPIIPHNIPAFIITPKAPWKPRGQSPILISQDEVLRIKNIERKNKLNIYGDGKEILGNTEQDIELVIQKAQEGVIFLVGKNYEKSWDNKVMQEQGFTS